MSAVISLQTARRGAIGPEGEVRPAGYRGRAASRLEHIAGGVAAISAERQAMLGRLLSTTLPSVRRGRAAERVLWVNEAMQRAYELVRLFSALERGRPFVAAGRPTIAAEWSLVHELAAVLDSLDVTDERAVRTCSRELRTAARHLVELFGPAADPVHLRVSVDWLALPSAPRRALVLASARLVVEALLRAAEGGYGCELSVTCLASAPGRACLRVAQESTGAMLPTDGTPSEPTIDLAALLHANVAVRGSPRAIRTELCFPTGAI